MISRHFLGFCLSREFELDDLKWRELACWWIHQRDKNVELWDQSAKSQLVFLEELLIRSTNSTLYSKRSWEKFFGGGDNISVPPEAIKQ